MGRNVTLDPDITTNRHIKKEIRLWVKDNNNKNRNQKKSLKIMLVDIDSSLDKGDVSSDNLEKRMNIKHELTVLENMDSLELAQKAKIKWSIEGDENSKYFHGIINKQRSNLAIRGILVDGTWIEDPTSFPNKLSIEQKDDLERPFTNKEIEGAIWDCGLNKSPGLDGFTFGFYRRHWSLIESDVVDAANHFFTHGFCPNGGTSSFIALILKTQDAKLIQSCLRSSRGSIIVNGSPTSEFQFHKGLKQRDPLSSFLFILVMESLHLSFQTVVNAGLFKGVVLDSSLQLSHLFYADDVVFLGQWSDSNINTIENVLECFFCASGSCINMHKSKIMGVAVENSKVTRAATNFGCMTLKAPFNYLGVKDGGRMMRINSWDEIINKLLCRLSKWKMKTLSIGGRLTLLKSVLGSMPIYYMSMFKVPLQVLKKMVSIRSHFFNGVEFSDKKMSLVKWDNVLVSKEKGRLENSWKDDVPFKSLYPRLYALESDKKVTVATKIAQSDLCSLLRRMPRGWVEQQQLSNLCLKVEGLILPNMCDRWYWSLSSNGEFSIASFNLSHRGMDLAFIFCPTCNVAVETTSHIFFDCHMVKEIYNSIASWWDIKILEMSSYEDWWDWLMTLHLPVKLKMFLE
ncbi:RNA-directed DNA polymerase, eukaryota [Tanacetum coccineum]